MAQAMDHLQSVWKAEATPHVGRRVLVSVRNSARAIAGTLVQVTDDGVLLDQDGEQVAVSYRRISAIELDRSPED
jgi:ferredoxin-fold anticodon binding domain-containing protein